MYINFWYPMAQAEELAEIKTRAAQIEALPAVQIKASAGPEGKLFGSVGPIDIVDAFSKVGVEVERAEVRMPDGPIHEIGDFTVGLHLHADINVDVNVKVVADE